MKTQLIVLEQGNILVSDKTENTGGKLIMYLGETLEHFPKQGTPEMYKFSTSPNTIYVGKPANNYWVVIASDFLSELPNIDYSALSEEDKKRIGYIDVEKLAFDSCIKSQNYNYSDIGEKDYNDGFIEGFKKAQSLNNEKFSKEDIEEILYIIDSENSGLSSEQRLSEISKHIKSLQQKSFDVEIEMKIPFIDGVTDGGRVRRFYGASLPKITDNKIKLIKLLCTTTQ